MSKGNTSELSMATSEFEVISGGFEVEFAKVEAICLLKAVALAFGFIFSFPDAAAFVFPFSRWRSGSTNKSLSRYVFPGTLSALELLCGDVLSPGFVMINGSFEVCAGDWRRLDDFLADSCSA